MASAAYRAAFFAPETDEVLLYLVRLSHPSLTDDVRVVGDHQALVHQGQTYSPAGFVLQLPEAGDGVAARARLTIENVSVELVETLQAATGAPTVTIRAVLASQPDTVEEEWPEFELVEVGFDAVTIEGDLGYPDLDAQTFGQTFTPAEWGGLA